MIRITSAQTLRSVLALTLALLFYALAIAVTVLLVRASVSAWTDPVGRRSVRAVNYAVGALLVLWTLWPRRERFKPPGPRLTREAHPQLFVTLEDIAAATSQRMPDDVYLDPHFNAWVREIEMPGGMPGKRIMGIGLPLFLTLPVACLRGVIAHEFAHFGAGHDRDALRFYRVERVLTGTVNRTRFMGSLAFPFIAYLLFFRAVTGAVSRRMEAEADRVAASLSGALAFATGLVALEAMGPAFDEFWWEYVHTIVHAGYRPPILDGFRSVHRSEEFQRRARANLDEALERKRGGLADSHPSLRQRLAALNVDPSEVREMTGGSSIELLGSVDGLEDELPTAWDRTQLTPITWDEIGATVEVPKAIQLVAKRGKRLRGLTPRTLPAGKKLLSRMTPSWLFGSRVDFEESAISLVGAALVLILRDEGWRVDWLPGESGACRRDGREFRPYELISDLAYGKLSREEWMHIAQGAGIADVDLAKAWQLARVSGATNPT